MVSLEHGAYLQWKDIPALTLPFRWVQHRGKSVRCVVRELKYSPWVAWTNGKGAPRYGWAERLAGWPRPTYTTEVIRSWTFPSLLYTAVLVDLTES